MKGKVASKCRHDVVLAQARRGRMHLQIVLMYELVIKARKSHSLKKAEQLAMGL